LLSEPEMLAHRDVADRQKAHRLIDEGTFVMERPASMRLNSSRCAKATPCAAVSNVWGRIV
jgi:hypothetical protein